jgi:acetylornithine deacetylase
MPTNTSLENKLCEYVQSHQDRLVEIIRGLVRIPSENIPPDGAESACQNHIAEFLRPCGCAPELYEVDEVAGLREHRLFLTSRNYAGRPNLGARLKGAGRSFSQATSIRFRAAAQPGRASPSGAKS